jgi:transcription elongation GreA/GreB family factor
MAATPVVSEEILVRFEKDVDSLAEELNHLAEHRRDLTRLGERLQAEAETFRRETQTHPNMLKEMHLRSVLGDLKTNLEQRAEEGRHEEEQHRTFEEQVLSLVVLYNDRVESQLVAFRSNHRDGNRMTEATEILGLIGRRETLQRKAETLRVGRHPQGSDQFPDRAAFGVTNHENLLLAKGFLEDRVTELSEQIERANLEEMELHRQAKLEQNARILLGALPAKMKSGPMVQNGIRVLSQQGGQGKARLLFLGAQIKRYRLEFLKTKQYLRTVEKRLLQVNTEEVVSNR